MNIDDLTIVEAKKLAALLGGTPAPAFQSAHIGKYVIVRTYSAGVHIGVLKRKAGREVELTEARRIWNWNGAKTLSDMSLKGLDSANSRVSETVASIELTEAIEVLPCTAEAETNLRGAKWTK